MRREETDDAKKISVGACGAGAFGVFVDLGQGVTTVEKAKKAEWEANSLRFGE